VASLLKRNMVVQHALEKLRNIQAAKRTLVQWTAKCPHGLNGKLAVSAVLQESKSAGAQ
jgi:hypothetical protein